MSELALFGGAPVRSAPWPKWPRANDATAQIVQEVLHSGRWSISGLYNGFTPFERRFAQAFAEFHEVPYAVPCSSGSAALTIALEAAGVRAGQEVLVPGLTWVACASAVASLNAIPIAVDIAPCSLCMSLQAAEAAITPNTSAILLVHSYCNIADIEGFVDLASRLGIPLIEDCSQAHGALWNDRRVGSFGLIGAFSMQNSKTLTSGEGGCCITRDPELYYRLQQFRADGREYKGSTPEPGEMELIPVGSVQGHNYCLSEFHSAILLDRLAHLDAENLVRWSRAEVLRGLLEDIAGVAPVIAGPTGKVCSLYRFCLRLDRSTFGDLPIEAIGGALSAELGLPVSPLDNPLSNNMLYNPHRSPRIPFSQLSREAFDPRRFDLPEATRMRRECLCIPHYAFLGQDRDMSDIVEAVEKVRSNSESISEKLDPQRVV
jgi:dTDP-4-amino-4,6-dideoxygalactose transaminase